MYVKEHLSWFGLDSRGPECLKEGMKELGLEVLGKDNTLRCKWGDAVPDISDPITWRNIFFCGKLVEHFSVCGWLKMATGFIGRWMWFSSTNQLTGALLKMMIEENCQNEREWSHEGRMVCYQPGNGHVGQCKLSCNWGITGRKLSRDWGCIQTMSPSISIWMSWMW